MTVCARLARVLGACLVAGALAAAAGRAAAQADLRSLDYRLMPRAVADGVYVIEGAIDDFSRANGCNIINTGFVVTGQGVVVVNTGPSRLYGEQMRKAIASVTREPVVRVFNLNLHPDYFFGNQGFDASLIAATEATVRGIQAEGKAYEDNLYRLCGDWMKGTETVLPRERAGAGAWRVGEREFELIELNGHTASDLVLLDRRSGVVFAGGLVFVDRVPTTPHADIPAWLASLEQLRSLPFKTMVPSHGRVVQGLRGVDQTAAYLKFLDRRMRESAERGLEMIEVLALPIPPEFAEMGAVRTEYVRNVTHLYPRYEREALQRR